MANTSDSAFAAAAHSTSLIDAIVAPLSSDALFLAPGDSFVRSSRAPIPDRTVEANAESCASSRRSQSKPASVSPVSRIAL